MKEINGKDTLTAAKYEKRYSKMRFKFEDHSLKQTNKKDKDIFRLCTVPDMYNDTGQKITDIKNRAAKIAIDLKQAGKAIGGYDKKTNEFNPDDMKFKTPDNEQVLGITAKATSKNNRYT